MSTSQRKVAIEIPIPIELEALLIAGGSSIEDIADSNFRIELSSKKHHPPNLLVLRELGLMPRAVAQATCAGSCAFRNVGDSQ